MEKTGGGRPEVAERLRILRGLLEENGASGYFVPSWDEYMSEYPPACARRLKYITGFTGSNGLALILMDKAFLFTDGRYLEQAKRELDQENFTVVDFREMVSTVTGSSNQAIAYDPELFTPSYLKKFFAEANLKPINGNLIDLIWPDQPGRPGGVIYLYEEEFTGQSHIDKIALCRNFSQAQKASHLVITAPDSVCWLLNLRSDDVDFLPVMLARVIVTRAQVYLFVDPERFPAEVVSQRENITILPPPRFAQEIAGLEGLILIDENTASVALMELLQGKQFKSVTDPCQLWKSIKNPVEIRCAEESHIQDAAAICEFLAYIHNEKNLASKTEFDLGVILTGFRSKQKGYVMDSFPVICGFQENGAIIHYHASEGKAKPIKGEGILLIDSGGQYKGATTDITRTIAIGKPTAEQKKRYTQVLKGHIALASIQFPAGTTGASLDILARQYLWQDGENYAHGTGHGVGSFLSVHEGPQSISPNNTVKLQPGMILSNEPGYYKTGEFGIRIENLIYVKEAVTRGYLCFEVLTLVPYDNSLIDYALLSREELNYLHSYYQKIAEKVAPLLSEEARGWLETVIYTRFL